MAWPSWVALAALAIAVYAFYKIWLRDRVPPMRACDRLAETIIFLDEARKGASVPRGRAEPTLWAQDFQMDSGLVKDPELRALLGKLSDPFMQGGRWPKTKERWGELYEIALAARARIYELDARAYFRLF